MTDGGDADVGHSKAIASYRQGQCPGCDRSLGDAKGLEYRRRSRDIFCHICKKAWSVEIIPSELRDEVITVSAQGTEISCSNPPRVQVRTIPFARAAFGGIAIRKFLNKIRLRR